MRILEPMVALAAPTASRPTWHILRSSESARAARRRRGARRAPDESAVADGAHAVRPTRGSGGSVEGLGEVVGDLGDVVLGDGERGVIMTWSPSSASAPPWPG